MKHTHNFLFMNRISWFLLLIFTALFPLGQINSQTSPLSFNDFLGLVQREHPLAQQAELLQASAKAGILQAKGAFDPKLEGQWEQKSFDGKNYFQVGNTELKLATNFGLEAKMGYNYASGLFLNPENNLPAQGQAFVGLSFPLLQGLMVDERRTSLAIAKLRESVNQTNRQLVLNDLTLEASNRYWEWTLAQEWNNIYQEARDIALDRFLGLKDNYEAGAAPAIDTLEAYIQVQDRELQLNVAQQTLQQARLELLNFLWQEQVPASINESIVSVGFEQEVSPDNLADASPLALINQHPAIAQYQWKLEELKLQRRFKTEQLKPLLNLHYQILGEGADFNPESGPSFNQLFNENYKLGATFQFPLFLRKARGGIQLTDLKMQEVAFDLDLKQQTISNKIALFQNKLQQLEEQIGIATTMLANYRLLVTAENEKFSIGESSLFLINSRENKRIAADLKLAKLQAERFKTIAYLRWSAGISN